MSLPKNLQDCYFFYYSACRKGNTCTYRHEPRALGHEQMCVKWQMGQCFQQNCPERHMVIEKVRNQIQCYWENKPNGCRKPHCVFKHTKRQNINNNTVIANTATAPPIPPNINLVAVAVPTATPALAPV